MSQSRFSIVLVGVSALLRRPLVSRLRPADGERSSWVVFAARSGRFDSGFRSAVGLRVHCFRFSARTASELPLGEFVLPPSASEIAARRVGLRTHCFRFSARTASGFRSVSWPSGSLLPLFGTHRFGVAAGRVRSSAFRFGDGRWAGWFFRSAGWPSGSLLPLFGTRRFGVAAGRVRSSAFRFGVAVRRVGLRVHCFRFSARTASEIALGGLLLPPSVSEIAAGRVRSSTFRFGVAARRVGLRVHCFRFSARTDPHRRAAEARTDGAHRHDTCFTSKHLSQHVNLPHRTP